MQNNDCFDIFDIGTCAFTCFSNNKKQKTNCITVLWHNFRMYRYFRDFGNLRKFTRA